MSDFFVDMALAVLFRVLADKMHLNKYRRAFQKLYIGIGLALEAAETDDGKQLPLVHP